MKKFTLCEDELLWEFLDETGIDWQEIFIAEIMKTHPNLHADDAEEVLENYFDAAQEELSNSRTTSEIKAYSVENYEQDEASGTWGYYKFEISEREDFLSIKKEIKSAAIDFLTFLDSNDAISEYS